jgi:hypothetical protein
VNVPAELLDRLVADFADALAPRIAVEIAARVPSPVVAEPWRLVGVDKVASALGRSKRWVHGAVKERGLPFVRLDSGSLRFDLDDVRAWALDRRVPAIEDDPLAARLQPARKPAPAAASNGRARPRLQKVPNGGGST